MKSSPSSQESSVSTSGSSLDTHMAFMPCLRPGSLVSIVRNAIVVAINAMRPRVTLFARHLTTGCCHGQPPVEPGERSELSLRTAIPIGGVADGEQRAIGRREIGNHASVGPWLLSVLALHVEVFRSETWVA